MSRLNPVSEVGLDRLDAYLSSDRSPPECMTLSILDGFLTALVIGPELVSPDEWMPVIWGGEEPSFADGDEAAAVLEGIRRRHDQLGRDIENGKFKPIFWIDTDGLVIAVDWRERRAGQPISRAVTSKPGRDDPCSCGSGKKFKKFCGA